MSKPIRVAIYERVSTKKQTTDNQERELLEVAARHGWEIEPRHIFRDKISGAKGRDGRPGFDELHKAIARKEIDLVAVWSVDRLGRSLQDLVFFLNDLQQKDVDLYLHTNGIDTRTTGGRALFQMMGVFAEFERSMIKERVRAGLERAVADGKTLGRPTLADKNPDRAQRVRELRAMGWGKGKIARTLNCGIGAINRILEEAS